MKYLILTFFFLSACMNQKKINNHHTHKLVRPLSVKFLAKDRVLVKVENSELSSVRLQVFHKLLESKTILFDGIVTEVKTKVDFNLDESFEDDGGVLAAVVTGLDSKNKEVSSVDSYVLGEQEEINTAKKVLKRN